jgi:signal transduction histidine kinase
MDSMQPKPPYRLISLFLLLLLLASGAIIYTNIQNMRLVEDLALQSLRSTAFSLASSAEKLIREKGRSAEGQIREILADRVIAYALMANADGVITFHTNPGLIGSRISSKEIDRALKAKLAGRRITLKTGIPAYEFDYTFQKNEGEFELLRLVLHTTPVDQIVTTAGRNWWTVGTVLLLLWFSGLLLLHMVARYVSLQNELEGHKRLSFIGQMTAVLTHEIRNALASIKGFTQLVDEKTPDSDVRKPGLEAIIAGTGRIEHLVNNLLLFSKDETYQIDAVEIVGLFREVIGLSSPFWKGSLEISGESEAWVKADKEKLHRVIDNGIRNARQAMGEMGVLTLSARKDGRWIEINIQDTGSGITQEDLPRLFTPFYTTKADGTGLGLSYSEKVIKGMGGHIRISNRTDSRGALLTIRLVKARRTNYEP